MCLNKDRNQFDRELTSLIPFKKTLQVIIEDIPENSRLQAIYCAAYEKTLRKICAGEMMICRSVWLFEPAPHYTSSIPQ